MLYAHFLLLYYMFIWLIPHLYQINGMWNKWNEMVFLPNFTFKKLTKANRFMLLVPNLLFSGMCSEIFVVWIFQIITNRFSINLTHWHLFHLLCTKYCVIMVFVPSTCFGENTTGLIFDVLMPLFLKIQVLCGMMLCIWQIVPDVLKDHNAFFFKVNLSRRMATQENWVCYIRLCVEGGTPPL
jgi:hypothetical protein